LEKEMNLEKKKKEKKRTGSFSLISFGSISESFE